MIGPSALLYPVLAQVLLTLALLAWTGLARIAALRAGRANIAAAALSADAWPDDVRKISNNYHNQFETPVLFYVLCSAAIYLDRAGPAMTALAWGYVASRLVHSSIHVTSNRVRHRFLAFAVGFWILLAMLVLVVLPLAAS